MAKRMTLHDCAEMGDIAGMALALAQGAAIDGLGRRGQTALMCAAGSARADVDTLHFLLERGADVLHQGGEYARAALIAAVRSGHLGKITALLDAGADVKDVALWSAVVSGKAEVEQIIALLLKRGAPIEKANHSNKGPSALLWAAMLGRFDVVYLLLDAGADEAQLLWTQLLRAVAIGSEAEVRGQLAAGADLGARDYWERTPWLLAVHRGDLAIAELLLAAGANRLDRGRCGRPPLMYAIQRDTCMLQWLIDQQFDLEVTDDFGVSVLQQAVEEACAPAVELLLRGGAKLYPQVIECASSRAVADVLLAFGATLEDFSFSMRSQLIGCRADAVVLGSEDDYHAAKHRCFGTRNPERFDKPFWVEMVNNRAGAWAARQAFDGNDQGQDSEAVWCFERFGSSITSLTDGRYIEIGGEHEDSYDPDFCIYNDVVVHDGRGGISIYGYPEELFPPTDFHSATLIGEYIYIIGGLGYPHARRVEHTPVYRLHCQTLAMERVETYGDNPGWIYKHKGQAWGDSAIRIYGGRRLKDELSSYNNSELDVDGECGGEYSNSQDFVLDLTTMQWSKWS